MSLSRKEDGVDRVFVNSVGEGAPWVCNTTGNLKNGDYVTTSELAGYGLKQSDGILHDIVSRKAEIWRIRILMGPNLRNLGRSLEA